MRGLTSAAHKGAKTRTLKAANDRCRSDGMEGGPGEKIFL